MLIPDTNDYDIFISEQEKIIFKQNEDFIPRLNLNVESASNEIIKDSIYNDSVNQNIIEQDNVTFKENVDFTSIKVLHIENINNNENV